MNFYRLLLNYVQQATPMDFAIYTLAAIIAIWFFSHCRE